MLIEQFNMSLTMLGLSAELANDNVAANALWPLTAIDTEAIRFIMSQETRSTSRTAEIMALAAVSMLRRPARSYTCGSRQTPTEHGSGQFEIDEIVLRRDEGYSSEQIRKFASVPEDEITPGASGSRRRHADVLQTSSFRTTCTPRSQS